MKPPELIQSAYDPETFRRNAHHLVDFLADCLAESVAEDGSQKTIRYTPPDQAKMRVDQLTGERFFEQVWEDSIRLHNPKFMGHQIMPPVPVSALAGFFSDMLNNGMGVYEMGIAGTAIERTVIQQVGKRLGFDEQVDGILTCGGSLANLTAMLAARSNCSPDNDWSQGTESQLALMVSEQSHYCVDRAARIMGWGDSGVIQIPTDRQFRMQTDLLESKFEDAQSRGITPIAVVGSACSTSTGSFDDLEAIGHFCRKHQLWFHVDGAHGAANAFSSKYRHLLNGIEMADSVTLDFHKMLMTPAITSALIFREGHKSYASFSQNADYLWGESESAEWFNLARRTFECTKTMLSLKIYSVIATHGWELLDANVTHLNDLAKQFSKRLSESEDFDVAIEPQTNIVCYRYRGKQTEKRDELNRQIRQRLLETGDFYIVQTVLNDEVWLRSTISNPLTQDRHFDELINQIRQVADEIQHGVSTSS